MGDPLTAKMETVLRELTWLAAGGTLSYNSTGAGGVPSSREPRWEDNPAEYWRDQWEKAVGTPCKLAVYEQAKAQLNAMKRRPITNHEPETGEEFEARILREGRGWSPNDCAVHFRTTPTFIHRLRVRHGVRVADGTPEAPVVMPLPKNDRAARAKLLRAEGRTMRQIAMLLKCDPMTVHRDLAA